MPPDRYVQQNVGDPQIRDRQREKQQAPEPLASGRATRSTHQIRTAAQYNCVPLGNCLELDHRIRDLEHGRQSQRSTKDRTDRTVVRIMRGRNRSLGGLRSR